MHDDVVVREFTHQAESFNRSAVANAPDLIDQIVELAGPRTGQRWLEAACGPGIISRALAPLTGEVVGVDATPAMVELARREAQDLGLRNASFEVADATALPMPDESFDGAVVRFAVHHIPVPLRLYSELSRVLRAGGHVVVVDHFADPELDSYAWSQELERLRDPSHWANFTRQRLREIGAAAGLELETENVVPMRLEFEEWLTRGSGRPQPEALARRLAAERPSGTPCFALDGAGVERTITLQISLCRWRRPR